MALDDDALTRALLMAGFGAMGQPNFWQGLGRAGMFGLQGYDQALTQRDRREEEAQQRKLREMQMEQARRTLSDQESRRALAARSFAPGVANLTPNDDEGNAMPSFAGGGMPEYLRGMWALDPDKALSIQQSMAKESPWAKLNPKDYTQDSLMRFLQTNNPADLKAAPDTIKVGTLRDRLDGQNQIQEEWDGKLWKRVGAGPRFKPEAAEKGQYDPARGVVVDPRTATAREVTGPGGAPLGTPPAKPPVEFLTQQTGVATTRDAIKGYRDLLKNTSWEDYLKPDARAQIGSVYNNMLLQAKEAYRLGVLNGPDYSILQQVVTNPMSMRGLATSKRGLDEQAKTLDAILLRIGDISADVHGQTPRGAPSGPAGVIDFNDLKKRR